MFRFYFYFLHSHLCVILYPNQPEFILITAKGNSTFPSMNAMYASLGLSYTLNLLYISVFLATSLAGVILNSLTLALLIKEKKFKQQPVYFFLKISTLTALLLNLFHSAFALVSCPQVLDLGNSMFVQTAVSFYYWPVVVMLGYYKFAINTLLILDRIAALKHQIKKFISFSPARSSLVLLLVSVLVILPRFFVYRPYKLRLVNVETRQETDMFIRDASAFARTQSGRLILNAISGVRSSVLCVIDIVLNVWTICLFRKFLTNKQKMTKFDMNALLESSSTPHNSSAIASSSQNVTPSPPQSPSYAQKLDEKNVIKLVMAQCFFSIMHQIMLFGTFCCILADENGLVGSATLVFVTGYVSVVRQTITFFIFYFFNKRFKRDVKALFK